MAQTSSAAVSRFVRRLGFSNYDDMRREAREEKQAGSPLYLIDHTFGASAELTPTASIERHAERFVDNLRSTFSSVDHVRSLLLLPNPRTLLKVQGHSVVAGRTAGPVASLFTASTRSRIGP